MRRRVRMDGRYGSVKGCQRRGEVGRGWKERKGAGWNERLEKKAEKMIKIANQCEREAGDH